MKSATLKSKRGPATLNNAPKGPSTKQKRSGPKSRLMKSTPGFSLYSSDEVVKPDRKPKATVSQSKGPRLINGDLLDAVSHEDDIVSQVQLVESKSKERQLKSQADVTDPTISDKIRSTTPDQVEMPGSVHVRTPFNKRLISSTPDPERMFSILDDVKKLQSNHSTERPEPNLSPQLVPEKDIETGTKSSTFDVISSMLMAQRQNQVLWQQQLEQFRHPPVIKVSENAPSAFQQWKGSDHGITNGGPVSLPEEINHDHIEENHHRAESTTGDFCQSEKENAGLQSTSTDDSGNGLSEENQVNPFSYNAYGTTSGPVLDSVKSNIDDIVVVENFPLQNEDTVMFGVKPGSDKQSEGKTTKTSFASKSKEETGSCRSKMPTWSKVTLKTSKVGVKVLPVSAHNTQQSSGDQIKSRMNRKITSKKQQLDKLNAEETEPTKKKKVLHVNIPRDERGMDVPPSFSLSDSDSDHVTDDICTMPVSLYKKSDIKMLANDSVSTCGEEVNSLISKESEKSLETPNMAVEAEMKEKLPDFIESNDKYGVEYKLIEKVVDTDCSLLKKDDDKVTYYGSGMGNNSNENKFSIEHNTAQQNSPKEDLDVEEKLENTEPAEEVAEETLATNECEAVNINQNYHDYHDDECNSHGNKRYRLHFLEKMADKTLMDIVCKLTLKATAIRDTELRDLIDDLVYNTDATLAREDGRFRSSQAFFMEENGKLKKRLHTVNKQLDAKERQERQADLYPGISNNDVMHLERKNLYLRQEKDRLDNQVTNLLEEKAMWLIKQQDLVKTISLKDREILKLEGKFQEEKKTLHKAVDEAAKNSQGVHFKLSVADREIANLEERIKTKDREITELKDALKDVKDDLQCCVDSRTEKNREIQRLQDLVNTLKVGVDEVMKAYEATAHSQPSTTDQRQGIESLRRLVTDSLSAASSLSHIPNQAEAYGNQRTMIHPENDRRGFSFSTSTRPELPSHHHHHNHPAGKKVHTHWKEQSQLQKHKQSQDIQRQKQQNVPKRDRQMTLRDQENRPPYRSVRRADTDDGIDWYAADSSLQKAKGGGRSRHESGNTLTVQALEDHNRRLSPIDRTLWHSLDTGHVMPPFTGDEPYHSDSEIHVINSRMRRRKNQERLDGFEERDMQRQQQQQQHRRIRRRSDDFTDRKRFWRCRECSPVDDDRVEVQDGRSRNRERSKDGLGYERTNRRHGSGVANEARNFENEPGEILVDDMESVTLNGEDNDSDIDRSRYSVGEYFKKYPQRGERYHSPAQRQQQQSEKSFPLNSKDYWVDSGTADDQDQNEVTLKQRQQRGQHSTEQTRSFQLDRQYPSLESVSVSDQNLPPSEDRRELLDPREDPVFHSTQRQQYSSNEIKQRSIRHGRVLQTVGKESQSHRSNPSQTHLSLSYPTIRSEGISSSNRPPETLSSDNRYPSLLSTSLPASSHQRTQSDKSLRNDKINSTSDEDQPRLQPYQQDYRSSPVDDRKQRQERQNQSSYTFVEKSLNDGRQGSSFNRNQRPHLVTFREPSTDESLPNLPSQSFPSEFLNDRTSFPPHSSPVNTSDISLSRRATRGSEASQQDFFRGTELSASYSSISDTDLGNHDYSNNSNTKDVPINEYGEESFNTGIASLDSKIAELEAKINRTKSVFS